MCVCGLSCKTGSFSCATLERRWRHLQPPVDLQLAWPLYPHSSLVTTHPHRLTPFQSERKHPHHCELATKCVCVRVCQSCLTQETILLSMIPPLRMFSSCFRWCWRLAVTPSLSTPARFHPPIITPSPLASLL